MRCKLKAQTDLHVLKNDNRVSYTTDVQKAEALASYFASVFFPNSEEGSNSTSFMEQSDTIDNLVTDNLSEITIQARNVLMVMEGTKCSTSAPFDGIPQIVSKKCARSLYKPSSMIFNVSPIYSEVSEI